MAQDLNKMMLSTLKKNENNAKRIKVWLDKIMVNCNVICGLSNKTAFPPLWDWMQKKEIF